jgi:hypothetical protein
MGHSCKAPRQPAANGGYYRTTAPPWVPSTITFVVGKLAEPVDTCDRRAGTLLLAGLAPLFPKIHTVIVDVGHESRKPADGLTRRER